MTEYSQASLKSDREISNKKNTGWADLPVHNYFKIAVIAALFLYLFRQEISAIVTKWFSDPSWSHGIIIPLFSLYFINHNKDKILNTKPKPSITGLILLIAVLIFYPFNIVHFQYGYFRPLSMIAALAAIVLFLCGWKLIKYLWLPIAFLVFAVPLPSRYYFKLTNPMRELAANISTIVLNLINGMEATANGVVIDVIYNGQRIEPSLNVADACSGMRLLMAFVALGVAMAYLHYRPIWQRIVLLLTTVPIAIFCNIVRVTITGLIYILGNPKYAQGIYHDGLGLLMLVLAFMLYSAIAWFMENLIVEPEEENKQDVIVSKAKTGADL